jgi:hypothetical protein
MRDPVKDANGHTFERSAIERSLVHRPGISPNTNAPYPDGGVARLTPNFTVRDMIDAFHEAAGEEVACALARWTGYCYSVYCCARRILGVSFVCHLLSWLNYVL